MIVESEGCLALLVAETWTCYFKKIVSTTIDLFKESNKRTLSRMCCQKEVFNHEYVQIQTLAVVPEKKKHFLEDLLHLFHRRDIDASGNDFFFYR